MVRKRDLSHGTSIFVVGLQLRRQLSRTVFPSGPRPPRRSWHLRHYAIDQFSLSFQEVRERIILAIEIPADPRVGRKFSIEEHEF
jgi:hypothetical protein